LSTSRQIGMEENPILVSEILAWLELNNINDVEQRKEYYTVIKMLDAVRQEWVRKQREDDGRK
jgi:hypothetical protein